MNAINMTVGLFMDEYFFKLIKGDPIKKAPTSSLKYYNQYADYLKRSLSALHFNNYDKNDFFNALNDYQNNCDLFFNSNDASVVAQAKLKIIHSQETLDFYEKRIKEQFIFDWNKNLTQELGEYSNFAIIVQATGEFDFRNPGRGYAIACSLFTDKLQKLYYDRKIGYVYNLLDRDLIIASTRDACSNFTNPLRFDSEMKYYTVIGSALGTAYLKNKPLDFSMTLFFGVIQNT